MILERVEGEEGREEKISPVRNDVLCFREIDRAFSSRQGEEKGRSLAGLTLHPNSTAMKIDDPPRDGQPQTTAGWTALERVLYLPEFLKNNLAIFAADADPVVFDCNLNMIRRHRRWKNSMIGLGSAASSAFRSAADTSRGSGPSSRYAAGRRPSNAILYSSPVDARLLR